MPKRAAQSARRSQTPNDLVDRQLARYHAMRDFAMTAEPHGASQKTPAAESDLPFVVQKHAATRLHYDFRLGWRGVLKSWAVTRGPSYNPADKRLAVEVEDHPIEYGGFEGAIPKGQYGGGTVMVWDYGTWEPHVGVDEGLRKGQLKFALHGQKLHGNWALIRMAPRGSGHFARQGKPSWLLIKEHDEFERGPDDPAISDEAPDSALTGRSLEQIAESEDHVWNSHIPEKSTRSAPATRATRTRGKMAAQAAGKPTPNRSRLARRSNPDPPDSAPDRESMLRDAPPEKMPGFVPPELAISVTEPPEGQEWLHELKLDGYRIQAHINEKNGSRTARLFTRNGLDWTQRMPAVAEAITELPVHAAILDGEVVVLDPQGHASFAELQASLDECAPGYLTYYVFDLLHLDGHNIRNLGLERRKNILEVLIQERGEDRTLRYSRHTRAHGGEMFRNACKLGAEGIVSKLATAPYRSKRSPAWLKSRCVHEQEFVIGGYTPYKGGKGLGALLLGYYRDGKLFYAGRTGTGFTQKMREQLARRLEPLRQSATPFYQPPAEAKKDAIWVKPNLVAEARFANWTGDHRVRQAVFLGFRDDKDPKEVAREDAMPVPKSSRGKHTEDDPLAPDLDADSTEHESAPDLPGPSADKQQPVAEPSQATVTPIGDARRFALAKPAPPSVPHRSASSASSRYARADVAGVSISSPDRILDEQSRLTKRRLAEYYAAVADHLLPHIASRPLSIVRCPEGSGKPCFFQKHAGMSMPRGVGSVPITPKNGGPPEEYLTVSTVEGLIGLAQMGVLEIHPWGSRNNSLDQPDRLIIDLDPDPSLVWDRLVGSAFEIRGLFQQLGIETFVKSTGGKGLHIVAPIQPRLEWPEVKDFAHDFVLMMERANPRLYLTIMAKSARTGRIFLDYLRNERGAVAPYSPRARAGARVAMPLAWTELQSTDPKQFTVVNFEQWKSRLPHDPWNRMNGIRQELSDRAVAAVAGILGNSK